jgi:ketopantoate reductase
VIAPHCTDNPAELGVQDVVITCLKAHSVTGVLAQMQPLLGPRTRIVTAVNGIPYWYFYSTGVAGYIRTMSVPRTSKPRFLHDRADCPAARPVDIFLEDRHPACLK